ncbi:MAG: hypothetical protein KUG69_01620 [Marinosulfonomonas sp.]|nr:hypothetical protein [Marinosulfonomonas sp.]
MSNDFLLVLGVLAIVFALPSLLRAFSTSQRSSMAISLLVVGGALVSWAIVQTPGGYSFEEIPRVFTGVIASIIR